MAFPFLATPPPPLTIWPPRPAAVDPPPPSKVKLLCSFGGQILPRPGDGALRYAGGHTRIVTVPKAVSYPDLMLRMADACGAAATTAASDGPVILKYKLPGEDLDALVSVSCAEDLENMMDEFDKIAKSSPDGSPKLRAFLFSPGEASVAAENMDDGGQRYLEAVNGFGAAAADCSSSSVSSTRRKERAGSTESSARNSDRTVDCISEGNSPALMSPNVSGSSVPAQNPHLAWPDPPPPLLPHQVYIEPPLMVGVPFTQQQCLQPYFPAAFHTTAGSQTAQLSSLRPMQARVDPILEENSYGGRFASPPSDFQHLPPSVLQPQSAYGFNQMLLQGQMLGLENCFMCRKALPHAQSDTLVQHNGNESPGGGVPSTSPVFYSLHSEVTVKKGADNLVQRKVEGSTSDSQLGAPGFPWIAEFERERPILQKINNLDDVAGAAFPPQSLHGVFLGNLPQHHLVPLQQEQPWHNLGSPQYQIEQEVVIKPHGVDAKFVRNENVQAPQPPTRDNLPECLYDYIRPMDVITESLPVRPTENSGFNEHRKAVAKPNCSPRVEGNGCNLGLQVGVNEMLSGKVIASSGIVPEGNFVEPIVQLPPTPWNDARMQTLQHADIVQVSNMIGYHIPYPPNPGISIEPPTPWVDAHMQNLQQAHHTGQVSNIIGSHNPYPPNLGRSIVPPAPTGRLLGMPVYSCSIDNDRVIDRTPKGDRKGEASQIHTNDMLNHLPAAQRGNVLSLFSTTTSSTRHEEPFQETVSSDSLFFDEDPWKILGGAHLLPPRPRWMAKNELAVSTDSCMETHLGNRYDSDIVALLEEGVLHQSPDPLKKDLSPEPVVPPKGSPEDCIKQELRAVAEGVAAPFLQTFASPVSVLVSQETKERHPKVDKEKGIMDASAVLHGAIPIDDKKIEDIKPTPSDIVIPALQITEGFGHLQIIKNSDLEELRELGSGTFGTVYHGKWRGSDVAIKRISNRCFAGKPSEEERTRADFWNEACKLADLHHPNVVAFYGVVLDGPGGSVATVTEYMANGSLRTALQRNNKIPGINRTFDRRKRLLIAMDVACGMEYLHGKNIVHFDLKSDNLLVNLRDPQRPICKVGDLGLSKVKCKTLISGGVRGTLPWMAPELLDGSRSLVSEKVDVFSFGIVMWELLTGQEPYEDLHYGAIIGGIVNNTLRPLVPEYCEHEWRLLMEKCWSSEPSERPSFTEVAVELSSMAKILVSEKKGHYPQQQSAVQA